MISSNIKKIREERKLSINELSRQSGVNASYISALEREEKKNPTMEILSKIAQILEVPLSDLTEERKIIFDTEIYNTSGSSKDIPSIAPIKKIPVLGFIRAGEPILAQQNIIDYIELPADMANSGEYFALRVIGDSMNLSRIIEGDIVVARAQEKVENGEIAVVLVNGEDATIKRFYRTDKIVTLVPNSSNMLHHPRIIDLSNVPVTVLGKIVKAIINF